MKMMISRGRLLASTIVAGSALMASSALAQTSAQTNTSGSTVGTPADATAPGATLGPVESQAPETAGTGGAPGGSQGAEIIVTGSRIPQPNLTSFSPVSVVNSQEIKLQGATRLEDVLNSLPQLAASQTSTTNNGTNGTATLNLRGLGEQRTLVLVDGTRLAPGDPNPKASNTSVPDINLIPSIMVKRVDVLTGGASAVYGADAVAGVVNFIMDTDFEGFSVDGLYGLFVHNNGNKYAQGIAAAGSLRSPPQPYATGMTADGGSKDIQAKFGAATGDGRGHVVAYVGYRKQAPVLQRARDYSACTLNEELAFDGEGLGCGGSATSYPGSFYNYVDADAVTVGPDRSFVANPPRYNYGPLNYLERQDKRYTAGFFAHYDVSDAFKPYANFMFMSDSTNEQDAPGGDFNDAVTQTLRVNCDNPLLGPSQQAFICQPGNLVTNADGTPFTATNPVTGAPSTYGNLLIYRRNVEGGPRFETYRHQNWRIVAGAKGDIAKGVTYDAYGLYGQTDFFERQTGYFQGTHINNATDVITGPDGTPMCRTAVTGSDTNCVPYDVFSLGGVTQDALNYLQLISTFNGQTKEKVASGALTFLGDEYGLTSPFATHGLGASFGAEHREESLTFAADSLTTSGDVSGGSGVIPAVSGGFKVDEAFGEVRIPIVEDKPFFQELSFEGGYRYSRYSINSGGHYTTRTFKLLGTYAPVAGIKFRGGYNRAVRAPNIGELFLPATVGLVNGTDPCAGATPSASQAQCVLQGVPASRYGSVATSPAGQYNEFSGGNTGLQPEKADTFTAGAIIQPMRNLSLSVDAYKINVKQTITTIGFNQIISVCEDSGQLCNLIHRDTNYTLWQTPNGYVNDQQTNFGSFLSQGIDFTASYVYRTTNLGSVSLSGVGSYLDKYKVTEPGIIVYDCAGLYGPLCGTSNPRWRASTRVTWTTPWNLGISLNWRYIGSTKVEILDSQTAFTGDAPDYTYEDHIKPYSYFDLAVTAKLSNVSLRLGANNILDKDPPILGLTYAPSGNGNTFAGQYDALGRYVYVGASVDF